MLAPCCSLRLHVSSPGRQLRLYSPLRQRPPLAGSSGRAGCLPSLQRRQRMRLGRACPCCHPRPRRPLRRPQAACVRPACRLGYCCCFLWAALRVVWVPQAPLPLNVIQQLLGEGDQAQGECVLVGRDVPCSE